jgi:exopolysaccharide biosynthesis polyprenyl glycosylphosphotransferase
MWLGNFLEDHPMNSFSVEESRLLLEKVDASIAAPKVAQKSALRNQFEKLLTLVEVAADWLTVVLAVNCGYGVYHILHLGRRLQYPASTLAYVSFAVATLFVLLLDRDGAYRSGSSLLRIKETERSLRVSAQTFLLILPITFFSSYLFSRWVFIIALTAVPVLQAIERQALYMAVRSLRAQGVGMQRVVIYGAGNSGRRVFSALVRSAKLGLNPVVIVDDNPDLEGHEIYEYAYRRGHSVKVVAGPITKELLEKHHCDYLMVAIPNLGADKFANAMQIAEAANSRLAFLPGHALIAEEWTERADIDGILLSVVGRSGKDWHYDLANRPFDLIASLALIVLLAPLWVVVAILVRLDSKGPIFFRQERVGRNGALFGLYKFRSMFVEAPKYGFSPTNPADPRITRIGRFLRRTSLDELPQLINVVRGDMSLVGPRPEMPFIVRQYDAVQRQRLEVTPGITGLWQLSADRALLIHENIQYDLYYIRHRSFFMDFAILLHTLFFAMHGV